MNLFSSICFFTIIYTSSGLANPESPLLNERFVKKIDELSSVKFIIPDELTLSRIEDAYRNPVSSEMTPLIYLAAKGKFDFLALVWASSDDDNIRMMAYLLYLMNSDKPKLNREYAFSHHSNKFIDSEKRLLEIKEINDNLDSYGKKLVSVISKKHPQLGRILEGNEPYNPNQ